MELTNTYRIEIENCISTLKNGGVILYPTDTIWGIGCDATNSRAIEKIFSIKRRATNKAMISLVDNKKRLKKYISSNFKIGQHNKPTTIIYPNVKGISNMLIANDGSSAFRLVEDLFCKNLIQKLKKPLVSTSANISGENHPKIFSDIKRSILEHVDYVVNLRQNEIMNTPSCILKFSLDGKIEKIR